MQTLLCLNSVNIHMTCTSVMDLRQGVATPMSCDVIWTNHDHTENHNYWHGQNTDDRGNNEIK